MKRTNFNRLVEKIEDLARKKPKNIHYQICALLKEEVFHYDWVGFYILNENTLKLGAYVGKPTDHTRIAIGKGVCGQVAEKKKTIIVQDVSQEDNYISCSIDVQSEIVVPVLKDGEFVAELDIDSHSPAPFSANDQLFLEKVCEILADTF
ncbi:GAF domain-containing protein [uncultured Sunxiuqinia sp.]|uniref:GAF domain-containing protein n=1 Tax=uncultured Sunxiuqinia sp. TaxID=1573825 RepID=UPI002AA8BD2F|nr:GAF domain-containing protein [uncultured Sunxiuqinia sp.]